MTFTQAELLEHINDIYTYFQTYKGDSKPNATNAEGIPYHSYETGYHWQIHEASATSECLGIMIRALTEAYQANEDENFLTYAKTIADFVIDNLNLNDIKCVHWLVNLIDNGVEMEDVFCGNYDGAVFTFTNGVCIIPEGNPWYGESVVPQYDDRYYGVRGVFSTDTGFKYKDFWVEPYEDKTEYTVDYYETIAGTGTRIVLEDTSFNGDAQVYYGIRTGEILNKNELYRTYPLNIACQQGYDLLLTSANSPLATNSAGDSLITNDIEKFQISCATDAIQWVAIALEKLATVSGVSSYSTVAEEYMDLLIANSQVQEEDYTIFDATNRGLTYFSVYTYDEAGTRNITLLPVQDTWQRMKYDRGSASGTEVVQWGIGSAFDWTQKEMNVKFRGNGSGALRYIVVTDANDVDFYYVFLDDDTDEHIFNIPRGKFCDLNGIFFDYNRIPYATPYLTSWNSGYSNYSLVSYSPDWEDSQSLSYPYWVKWDCSCSTETSSSKYSVSYSYGGAILGFYALGGVETTKDTVLKIIGASTVDDVNILYRVIDANGTTFTKEAAIQFTTDIQEFEILFTDDYFDNSSSIVHPIQDFEFMVESSLLGDVSHTIYIAALRIHDKDVPVSPLSVLKFETRDQNAGYFDIGYATLEQGNTDVYPYSGVAVFSNEYYEDGLMNWRSGSYAGYTNPYAFPGASNNAIYAAKFIYDSQVAYRDLFGTSGPSIPVYLRNLGENLVYGDIGDWTWDGPDPNTTWAGFQYRAMENMADHYYFNKDSISANEIGYCKGFLQGWTNYLYPYILANDAIPSTFYDDGTLPAEYESPDFFAQLGRAMLLKYLVDWDAKSWYIVQWCYDKLILLKQSNGSYKQSEDDTYNFHQCQIMLFFAELYNFYDEYKYTTGMTDFTWNPKKVYTGAIEFRTEIFESFSGKEQRVSETVYPIRRWKLEFDKNNSELGEIRAYVNNLKGRYSKFNWVWPTSHGGDGNEYSCRLAADDMVTTMQHLGFGNFTLTFEAIDENAYDNLTEFTEAHNIDYEQQEQHSTAIDGDTCANMAVNVQWESTKKRWNLTFEKNETSRKWLENFFISQKGRYNEWQFTWSASLGGDGNTYQVRFDTDTLDFDVSYLGFGTFTIPIIEVL